MSSKSPAYDAISQSMKIIVVIPIYKTIPSSYEILSIERCFTVLHQHTIQFIHPEKLDLRFYKERFQTTASFNAFPNKYFKSIQGYSKLMLSVDFYSRFTSFDYILIYQPDSYIFRDELTYWCAKNYDYIGGIWFNDFTEPISTERHMTYPGNGGFSLRKVGAMVDLLSSKEPFERSNVLVQKIMNQFRRIRPLFPFIRQTAKLTLRLLGWMNCPSMKARFWRFNEDSFFIRMATRYNRLHIPPVEEAVHFAWDIHPAYLYSKYKTLPMATHTWFRQKSYYQGNLDFWKNHIALNQPPLPSQPTSDSAKK